MNKDTINKELTKSTKRIQNAAFGAVKLLADGLLCGVIVGVIASIFARGIGAATMFRAAHPWVIFGLPLGAIIINRFYQRHDKSEGTDTILMAASQDQGVPANLAPLIFCSTIVSHFFGASVGREGAALQIGGCIGAQMSDMLHKDHEERRLMVMAGMSAAFSALFGTPMAAAVTAMEISNIGVFHYDALVPCVVAALPAYYLSGLLGVHKHPWALASVAPFTLPRALGTCVLAALCAVVSILLITALGRIPALAKKKMPVHLMRVIVVSIILLGLTLLSGGQNYNGSGSDWIELCLTGGGADIPPYAFLVKILFTAVSLAACFKGGEIVPSLFVGATFGSLVGPWLGIPSALGAAIGMGCLFSSITNCPLASLLLCFEMFGFEGWPYYMLSGAIAYMLSGNYGLYHRQKIRFSKISAERVDSTVHH